MWALLGIGKASHSDREEKPPYRILFSFTNYIVELYIIFGDNNKYYSNIRCPISESTKMS